MCCCPTNKFHIFTSLLVNLDAINIMINTIQLILNIFAHFDLPAFLINGKTGQIRIAAALIAA
jgi:hypothetical protein